MITLTELKQNSIRQILYLEAYNKKRVNINDLDSIFAIAGSSGFGIPEAQNTFLEGMDYNTFLGSKFQGKDISLKIYISGENRSILRSRADAISDILTVGTYTANPKLLKLVYSENFHTPNWYINCVYENGLNWEYGKIDGTNDNEYIFTELSLKALTPYFESETETRYILGGGGVHNNGCLLLPQSFSDLLLASTSQTFNNYSIFYNGTYKTSPVIRTINRTPVNRIIAINNTTGQKLEWQSSSVIQNIQIDFTNKEIINLDNNQNLYSGFVGTPEFFDILQGENKISFVANNEYGISNIEFTYKTRKILTL